jgi:phosphatidate phosphatase APP1
LKDWSPTTLGKHHDHKLGIIRTLLKTYPGLPFVLIGDSGEEDPEIYHQAAIEHPGRVRAIYIRDVTSPERDREVHAIAEKLRRHGVEMVLTGDTGRAAEHAAGIGLIPPKAVDRVRARRDAPG